MITMIDEVFDRAYRDGRAQLNSGLTSLFAGLGKAIGNSFTVLNRIEWSAPWEQKSKRARVH